MFSSDLLKGRAIFLNGGGSGLGRSMAIRILQVGCAFVSRRAPRRTAERNLRRNSPLSAALRHLPPVMFGTMRRGSRIR